MNFGIAFGSCLISFLIIGLFFKIKNYKLLFYTFDLFVSVFVYFIYVPVELNYDMTRYDQLLDVMRFYNSNGLSSGLHWALNYSPYASQPFDAFYIWLFSLLKNNGYLFAVTIFLFLLLISKLVIKVCENFTIDFKVGLIVQVIILSIFCLGWEISGLRNNMAFIVFVVALYYDATIKHIKDKKFVILLYVLAYLIHPSIIIFLIFRLLFIFNNKLVHILVCVFALGYTLFINNILNLVLKINVIPDLDEKANAYLYGGQNFNQFENNIVLGVVVCILLLLIVELIFYTLYFKNDRLKKYTQIYITFIVFAIGSYLNTQIFLRTTMLLLFMSIPLKMIILAGKKQNIKTDWYTYKLQSLYKISLLGFSFFLFVFWYHEMYSQMLLQL